MSQEKQEDFEIKINVPMIKELVSDKIYRSDASAFREQYVNALSHGCIAYHQEKGYTDDVFVHVLFDYGMRKVTITDNGMGMDKTIFSDNFMSFGFSTVGKDTNNKRSGMFGLGAISFFRIAGACVVESWDRKTDERFCFMTRNTDESEFVANRTLEGPGTRTEITLKEHVRMSTLVDMVKKIARNYPVKTILEVTNSESEQTIATYNRNDTDSYEEFEPIMRFKDFVIAQTDNKFVTLIDNEEMELYLSTTGGNKNHSYLCRVPIDIAYSTGFTTYLNMKQEKIKGTDKYGKDKLQEIPKPDRDQVNEIAEGYFSKLIEKKCDEMIYDIDIKSFEEYENSDARWILNGYSVDDKLNTQTHTFVQKMREPVRFRTGNGIQKRHQSLLTLFGEYETIMFHPSLHKGTYDSIDNHLRKLNFEKWKETNADVPDADIANVPWSNRFALVDNHCDQPMVDAKEYKKKFKVKSIVSLGSSKGASTGLLVRDGSWNNFRLTNETVEEALQAYPGGLYYADGWMKQNDISTASTEGDDWYGKILKRNKAGIIITQKAKKLYPSITTLFDKFIKASEDGKIVLVRSTVRRTRQENTGPQVINFSGEYVGLENIEGELNKKHAQYRAILRWATNDMSYVTILPIQCMNTLPMLKCSKNDMLFLPIDLMHSLNLIKMGYNNDSVMNMIGQLKHLPKWTQWSEKTSNMVWTRYNNISGRYGQTNSQFKTDVMNYLVSIEEGLMTRPDEETYEKKIRELLDEHDESWHQYDLEYNKMFPTLHLEAKAKAQGWSETESNDTTTGSATITAYTQYYNGMRPMEINGKYYSVAREDRDDWKAVLDDDGNPQLVNMQDPAYEIVLHEDKLKFKREMTEWD